jgi:hypothetical protein
MQWPRNSRKALVTREYEWKCMECKTCEICALQGDDVSDGRGRRKAAQALIRGAVRPQTKLMFCDRCDRGWHLYCLNPPLAKPPRGELRRDTMRCRRG